MFEQVKKKKGKPGGASSGPLADAAATEDLEAKIPKIDEVLSKSKDILKVAKKKPKSDCCVDKKTGCCF